MQQAYPKRCCLYTNLHRVISQETGIVSKYWTHTFQRQNSGETMQATMVSYFYVDIAMQLPLSDIFHVHNNRYIELFMCFSRCYSSQLGPSLLIVESSRSHSDTPPLNEWSVRRRELYLTIHNTHKRQTTITRRDSNPQFQQASGRRSTP